MTVTKIFKMGTRNKLKICKNSIQFDSLVMAEVIRALTSEPQGSWFNFLLKQSDIKFYSNVSFYMKILI